MRALDMRLKYQSRCALGLKILNVLMAFFLFIWFITIIVLANDQITHSIFRSTKGMAAGAVIFAIIGSGTVFLGHKLVLHTKPTKFRVGFYGSIIFFAVFIPTAAMSGSLGYMKYLGTLDETALCSGLTDVPLKG
jgi:hypothetical protein